MALMVGAPGLVGVTGVEAKPSPQLGGLLFFGGFALFMALAFVDAKFPRWWTRMGEARRLKREEKKKQRLLRKRQARKGGGNRRSRRRLSAGADR